MKLSPHEVAHVALSAFAGVPANDPATGLPNSLLAVAVALAESGGDTDAMHMSDVVESANYGQVDHGLWQISGRWNAARYQDITVVSWDDEEPMDLMGIRLTYQSREPVRAVDIESGRLMGMGDWRDPYNNGLMARALFDEWWRKENAPAYMAEKRKEDPVWQPSGWRAWSVYTSGSAWKTTTSAPKNRFIEQARFGVAAAVPAPRPVLASFGEVVKAVGYLRGSVETQRDAITALAEKVTSGGEERMATLEEIRAHFT